MDKKQIDDLLEKYYNEREAKIKQAPYVKVPEYKKQCIALLQAQVRRLETLLHNPIFETGAFFNEKLKLTEENYNYINQQVTKIIERINNL